MTFISLTSNYFFPAETCPHVAVDEVWGSYPDNRTAQSATC
jgi:hypothetical protein